jgi:hypothetical protein
MEASDDDLRAAVERACGCRARPGGTVEVRLRLHRYALWEGLVHAFVLDGYPVASLCYAWSSSVGEGGGRRVRVVPAVPPITSAADAVRAAVVQACPGRGEGSGVWAPPSP